MLQRRKHTRSGIRDNDGPIRNASHRQWVRGHVCAAPGCVNTPIECAHVDYDVPLADRGGMGLKNGDNWTWPLCGGPNGHHAESHRIGAKTFAAKYRLDPHTIASDLWRRSPHKMKQERQ